MPIQIGTKTGHGFNNPIGLLTDCHRRIKKFLMIMITVMRQTHGGPLLVSQQQALETALQYFREAAPKHTMDEEKSLFPRMRLVQEFSNQNDIRFLDHLEKEHEIVDESHHQVEMMIEKWLKQGELSFDDSVCLSNALGRLSVIYKKHIYLEEKRIFPLAARMLSRTDVAAIGREMAIRRNIDLDKLLWTLNL